MKLSIQVDKDGSFRELMKKAPERIRAAIVRGLYRSSEIVAAAAVRNITKNKQIVSGNLRASMAGGWVVDERNLIAVVGPSMNPKASSGKKNVNYGYFVEHGRASGRMPPRGVLREYVRRKMGVSESDVDRAEFALRRAIARRGTKRNAKPFLRPALEANRTRILAAFEKELKRELQSLDSK